MARQRKAMNCGCRCLMMKEEHKFSMPCAQDRVDWESSPHSSGGGGAGSASVGSPYL